jgi:hypothetical protein
MKVFLSWSAEASQEAGALAHLPHLAPFLFRLERGALSDSPLMRFQLTEFSTNDNRSKGEFYKLIEDVNKELTTCLDRTIRTLFWAANDRRFRVPRC